MARFRRLPSQRLTPPPWAVRWRFEVLDFGAPANARDASIRFLRDRGDADADYLSAEIVFGELIGNVVRHAQAPLFLELDWSGEYPVLHVQDRGPGFDWKQPTLPAPDIESGRGLYLAASLSRDLEITRIPNYGTHIRVVLNIARNDRER